jgi:hypothetical protein
MKKKPKASQYLYSCTSKASKLSPLASAAEADGGGGAGDGEEEDAAQRKEEESESAELGKALRPKVLSLLALLALLVQKYK